MSTAAEIRSAWNTNVFQHASIQALTTSIYDRDMPTEGPKALYKLLKFAQEVNYIQYIVSRTATSTGAIGARQYNYEVQVTCFRETDVNGTNHNAAVDALGAVEDRVIAGLGTTWAATVDRSEISDAAPEISEITIEGKRVIAASKTFTAEKFISD